MDWDAGPDELKALIDVFGVPTFVLDARVDGTLRYAAVNAILERMCGLRNADLAGRRPEDCLPPDIAQAVSVRYAECVAVKAPVQYEEALDVPGGRTYWRTTLSPLIRDGRVVRLIGTAVDISDLRRSELARAETEERLRDFLATASDSLWEMDADLRFSFLSGGEAERSAPLALGKTPWEVVGADPDRDARWAKHRDDLLARRLFRDFEVVWTGADGGTRHRRVSGKPLFAPDGTFRGYRGVARDVTEEVEAERKARESDQRLALALDAAQAGWFELDLATNVAYYSANAEIILGYAPGELSGTKGSWQARVHPDDLPAVERAIEEHDQGASPVYRAEYRQRTKDGGWRWMQATGKVVEWDAHGAPRRLIGIRMDAHERKTAQLEIEQLALTDSLTGLPNRAHFLGELERALARLRRGGRPFVVLVLDLDHFKEVNDTLGHSAGDRLLVEAAGRLRAKLRTGDLLARLGGDEFAIVAQEVVDPFDAHELAERLIRAFDEPVLLNGTRIRTGTSIGVAVCAKAPENVGQIMVDADVALYAAKSDGRSTWRLYDARMEAQVRERRTLERDLQQALEEEQFELLYQPVIDLRTLACVGVEALIRWNHPERGRIAPGQFIPAAERNRLIEAINQWVVQRAFIQSETWQIMGLDVALAVNLSTPCLRTEGLIEHVVEALAVSGADPKSIVVEIAERSLADEKYAVPMITALRARGVAVAVDDFGAGYASMARLKLLPVDHLKIDRSFITELTSDHRNAAITEAIIKLAVSLDMTVVAEGVETIEEMQRLIELGCHRGQGFLFARPMPAGEFPAWAAAWRRREHANVHDLLREHTTRSLANRGAALG